MNKKSIVKMVLDLAMTVLLPLLMIQAIAGEELHEWIGILMFALFIAHHLLNFNWHKNLLKGRYSTARIIGTILNLAIFICMVLCAVSGIILSQYVFAFFNINQGLSFARAAHMICTHWMFVLTSVHLGMHFKIIKGYLEKSIKRKPRKAVKRILLILTGVMAAYGATAFIRAQLWQYLLYQTQYMFFDFSRAAISVYFDYVCMMLLFSCFGCIKYSQAVPIYKMEEI